VGGDQGDPALGGGQLAVDEVEGEGPGLQREPDDHADGADERERPAADPVDEDHGDHGADDVDDRRGERVEERVRRVDAHRLPQRRGVVEGDVDADELLEDREPDTDPDDRLEEEGPAEQVLEDRLVLPPHRQLDLGDAGVQVDLVALDLAEHLAGPAVTAGGDQEAGRLGDREGEQSVDDGRNDHHAEHDLPGLQAHDLAALVAVRGVEDAPVDELRDGDAGDDGGLLEGAEPSAVGGRGDLGDVGRADDRGHADGEAADDPPEGQVVQGEGQRGAHRADGEERGRDLHAADAADAVGDPARGGRADRTADQGDGDDLGEGRGADVVPVPDGLDGAVDHSAVVTEEEATHRGRGGDEDDVPEMLGVSRLGSGRGWLRCAGHV
jgi:hypothetical protein